MILNVGCGSDCWGDVRLDIAKTFHGKKTCANIYGDAQNLPFRDRRFAKLQAHHIIEHLPNWKKAILEWCRVTKGNLEIEWPLDPGFVNRQIYFEIVNLAFKKLLILPQRRREHLWKFNPEVIVQLLENEGFAAKWEIIKFPLIRVLKKHPTPRNIYLKLFDEKIKVNGTYRVTAHRIKQNNRSETMKR